MIGNLFRIALVIFYTAVFMALLLLAIWIANRGIQFFAARLGYEVGDFFQWVAGGIRKWNYKRRTRNRFKRSKHGVPKKDL